MDTVKMLFELDNFGCEFVGRQAFDFTSNFNKYDFINRKSKSVSA